MFKIPPIRSSNEIIDSAFRKAAKVQVVAGNRYEKHRKMGIAKVRKASNTISSTLTRYVKSFPNFESLSGFYFELFDITLEIDRARKSLGALSWCAKTVRKIADDTAGEIQYLNNKDAIKKQLGSAYGRMSSVVKQISEDLEFLKEARDVIKKTPQINLEMPTIVIAGAPNVGKSLLVSRISTARPKIASYPFTTKAISVGHFERENVACQVIDTPGLLDREMDKRNEMEEKAILALKHLANVIVFLLDPSEQCGYSMDSQLNILRDMRTIFASVTVLEVENKKDIISTSSSRVKVSALSGEGMDELNDVLFGLIQKLAF